MSDAIKLAIDFLHCVDQRFDLAKEPHAPGVTMLDQFHAALAALRAQPASQYLCNGTPFKVAVRNGDAMLPYLPDELGGRWVALVAAEDDCHLRAQPDHSELARELREESDHELHFETRELLRKAADALEGKQ